MGFSIAKECFFISSLTLVISSACLAAGIRSMGIFFFLLFLFVLFFFRDPDRLVPDAGKGEILSPADGTVIKVDCTTLSIFMSLFDVHVNRSPVGGEVQKICYQKGMFRAAFLDEAQVKNERNTVIVQNDRGEVAFTQIAGIVARRIVCFVSEGDNVKAGERIGMIRFGSRVDLEVPGGATIIIKRGDHVKSGESIIGVTGNMERK